VRERRVPRAAASRDDEIHDPTEKPLSPRIARFIGRDITLARSLV
jgi:hypothetical protein